MPLPTAFPTPAAPGSGSRSQSILVVDDNVDSARCLAIVMRRWGHTVRLAHTGGEALRAAEASLPDTALLDVKLPDMSGQDVARRLRGMSPSAELQLIGISGFNMEADDQTDFHHYLVKPIDFAALHRVLASRDGADATLLTALKPR